MCRADISFKSRLIAPINGIDFDGRPVVGRYLFVLDGLILRLTFPC
jgi:hypothetical protein